MILTAFRLRRDRHTEKDTFGHTRPVVGMMQYVPAFTPTLGCPIETPLTIKTSLVKMVEYYNRNQGAVVVERLGWMFGSSIYPYKAKFIHLDTSHTGSDVELLFLQNLSTIHKKLTRNQISFSSPIQYYFNTVVPPWHHQHRHEHLIHLNDSYRNWIGNFAYARDDWSDTKRFIDMFDCDQVPDDAETHFKNYILPKPTIKDPYTFNNHARPIDARDLFFERSLQNHFDVTPPIELTIAHPENTLYSPKVSLLTMGALEELMLQYSDLSLEYILSGTAVVSCKENYLVSRYRDKILVPADIHCRWIVVNEVLELLYRAYQDTRLVLDIRVTFVITYGEEALIEVFEHDTNKCIGAVHFDLAMLALCAPSIAACVDPF